jgi:hypothetical protein
MKREDPYKKSFETQIIKSEKVKIWALHYNNTGENLNLEEIKVDLEKLRPVFEKYKPLSPREVWRKNMHRADLRSFTREFQKLFSLKEKTVVLPGSLYAATYSGGKFPTDKHHATPLFLSFGRFKDDDGKIHTRGINLLYLKTEQQLEILEEATNHYSKKPDNRVAPMIKLHEKWMKIVPYAFKNFEDSRIVGLSEVENFDWGMVPLLQKYLLGNFNAEALNEDFQEEHLPKPEKKKKEKKNPLKIETETASEAYDMIEADFVDEEDLEDF